MYVLCYLHCLIQCRNMSGEHEMCSPDRCGWKMLMFIVKRDRLLGTAEKRGRAVDLAFARLCGLDCSAARTFPHVHVLQTSSAVWGVSLHLTSAPWQPQEHITHTHTLVLPSMTGLSKVHTFCTDASLSVPCYYFCILVF